MRSPAAGTPALTEEDDAVLLEALWPESHFYMAAVNSPHPTFFAINGIVEKEDATARLVNVALVLLDEPTAYKYQQENPPFYWIEL